MSSQPSPAQPPGFQAPQPAPSKLPQAKAFGGVGSILVLLAFIPYAGAALAIIGLVLILVAIKYISDEVGDRRIFNNALIAVIIGIVGTSLAVILLIPAMMGSVFAVSSIGAGGIITIDGRTITISRDGAGGPPTGLPPGLLGLFVAVILILIAIWIVQIVSALFLKRSYDLVARYLGIGLFSTAALLYLIGAALLIILIGFILILVAGIIQAIAFFSLPDRLPYAAGQNSGGASPQTIQ